MAGQEGAISKPAANQIRAKNAPKAAPQDMPISLKQSTDTVKMLLHASISSLSWIRSLFSDKYFDVRVFDEKAPLQTYEEYLETPLIENDLQRSSGRTGTPMRHLNRGRGKTGDLFLNQLELAAFDAIEKGYLKALQLRVFEDESHPNCILESYTFTIEYDKHKKITTVSKVEVMGHGRSGHAIPAVKQAFNSFLRTLIEYAHRLPSLPDVRFLEMYLIFNEFCPAYYQPDGFKNTLPEHIWYPHTTDWILLTQDIQGFKTGYHSMDFVISHLNSKDNADVTTDQIPSKIPHVRQYSAWQDILTPEEIKNMDIDLDDTMLGQALSTQDLPRKISEVGSQNSGNESLTAVRTAASPTFEAGPDPEHCDVGIEMEPPNKHSPDQPLIEAQQDALLKNPTPRSQQNEETQQARFVESQGKLWYSQQTLIAVRRALRNTRSTKITRKAEHHTVVRCSCNYNEGDDQMIVCSQCRTWQHAECYGYINSCDTRLPDKHICYRCLLRGKERQSLQELEQLAFERRAVETLRKNGWQSLVDLSKRLGCSTGIAGIVAGKFRQSGYLIDKNHQPAGWTTSSQLWILKTDAETQEKLLAEYFDPTRGISHHFQNSATEASSDEAKDSLMHHQIHNVATHEHPPETPLQLCKIQKRGSSPNELPTSSNISPGHYTNFTDKENVFPPGNQLLYDNYKINQAQQQNARELHWAASKAKIAADRDIVFETPVANKQNTGMADKRKRADEGKVSQDEGNNLSGRLPKRMRASRAKNYLRVTMSS